MAYGKQWLLVGSVVLAAYLLLLAIVYTTQRKQLYFPTHQAVQSRLESWYVGNQLFGASREVATPRRVWLMLHGNGGQAEHRDYVLACVRLEDAIFVLEYPGYGLRPGLPSRATIDAAASAAYRALRTRYPGVPLGIIGESIGSGPACVLAQEPTPPDAIVLITPFDTLASVAAEKMWFIPAGLLLRDRWDNVAALRGYRGRITIYGASHDGIIPIHHARALAVAAGAKFIELPSGHNDWMDANAVKL
jgi:alpha-beta hydrolase superfamily lysophospholipase